MLFEHQAEPGRGVRLAYCSNLHPAEDLAGVLEGMRRITLPLARRFEHARLREGFGVGLWLPADLALACAAGEQNSERDELLEFLAQNALDAFTFNAFPYGGFHRRGLKDAVFRPTWKSPERLAYTLAVARIALAARALVGGAGRTGSHLSISTHAGMHRAWVDGEADLDSCAANLATCVLHLSRLQQETGQRIVLALEPEPRSIANDTNELADSFERVRRRETSTALIREHLGSCLDTCHAAVEFEEPQSSFANATSAGHPLGKLQFSSALALERPDERPRARELLFAMDEPRFLHQVTARGAAPPRELVRADDLPDLRAAWEAGDPRWRGCEEWRCHFHVPVDLERLGSEEDGLTTTRAAADRVLFAALEDPSRWGTRELHVEIETYTWGVLPSEARGEGDLVDGLEREYRHVIGVLERAGWRPARS